MSEDLVSGLVSAGLLLAGVIHLLPVTGVVGSTRLSKLYGVNLAEPALELLMRHRAVLFGIVGGLLCAAAFEPSLHRAALLAGYVSVISFLAFAPPRAAMTAPIRRIVNADWLALAGLAVAGAGDAWLQIRA